MTIFLGKDIVAEENCEFYQKLLKETDDLISCILILNMAIAVA